MTRMQSETVSRHLGKSLLSRIARIERSKKLSMACGTRQEILSRESLAGSKNSEEWQRVTTNWTQHFYRLLHALSYGSYFVNRA